MDDDKAQHYLEDGVIVATEADNLVLEGIPETEAKHSCLYSFFSRSTVSEWTLLVACCVCNTFMIGYSYAMGALFLEMKESFGASRAETALVQSITIGVMSCGGILSPLLISTIGTGNTLLVGTVIASSAVMYGCFVESILVMILVVGGIGGFGLSNQAICMFTATSKMFKHNIQFALAALILSGGMGYFVFPYVNVLILERYTWRGVFMIHSGLILHGIPLALYIKTVLPKPTEQKKNIIQTTKEPKRCLDNSYIQTHISLWKNPLNATFFVCLIPRSVPLGLVTYFMLDIAAYKSYNEYEGSLFLSAVGFGNIVGRVAILVTRTIIGITPVMEYSWHVIFTGGTLFILGFCEEFSLVMTACIVFGMGYGLLTSTANIAVFSIGGEQRYPTALSISNTAIGIGFWIAGPIGGAIKDNIESYDLILYGFGIICTLSGLCVMLVACCYKSERTEQTVHVTK